MSYKNFAASVLLAFGAIVAPMALVPQQAEAREVAIYEFTCARRGTSFTIDKNNQIMMFHNTGAVSYSDDYADTWITIGEWVRRGDDVTVYLRNGDVETIPGLMSQRCDSYYG